jgi:16S rRNA (cytidine1402-2'-O)-methyltransferase
MAQPSTGTLFLVSTPIGNLEDITLRALRVLREVSLIAAEDTRRTAKLLNHFDIRTPTTSLHEHNEDRKIASILERLAAGDQIAVVSDAGTPAVSDPGFELVRAAIGAGVRVESIPGASAVLAALVVSGLPTDQFVFLGFPPSRAGERAAFFASLGSERRTMVFFEAPHRIAATLANALEELGDRQVAVCREVTKLHETLVRGPISSVQAGIGVPRGEYTVVIAGCGQGEEKQSRHIPADSELFVEFCCLTNSGHTRRAAISQLARRHRMQAGVVYQSVERARKS